MTTESFDDHFDRSPDIWYENGVDREMRYWCIDGVWHWRCAVWTDAGWQVIAEGVGGP